MKCLACNRYFGKGHKVTNLCQRCTHQSKKTVGFSRLGKESEKAFIQAKKEVIEKEVINPNALIDWIEKI